MSRSQLPIPRRFPLPNRYWRHQLWLGLLVIALCVITAVAAAWTSSLLVALLFIVPPLVAAAGDMPGQPIEEVGLILDVVGLRLRGRPIAYRKIVEVTHTRSQREVVWGDTGPLLATSQSSAGSPDFLVESQACFPDAPRALTTSVEELAEPRDYRDQACVAPCRHHTSRSVRSNAVRLGLVASAITETWRESVLLVKPETILRSHRQGFQMFWRWRTRHQQPPQIRISIETIELIRRVARENHLWGAERIRGELLKLGIRVAKRTVQKYLRTGVKPRSTGQRWATLLENHGKDIWACAARTAHGGFASARRVCVGLGWGWERARLRRPGQGLRLFRGPIDQDEPRCPRARRDRNPDARKCVRREARHIMQGSARDTGSLLGRDHRKVEAHAFDQFVPDPQLEREAAHAARSRDGLGH
jgi:hypothetical protein